jgi:HlyD family secretion protein
MPTTDDGEPSTAKGGSDRWRSGLVGTLLAAVVCLSACSERDPNLFQGYVESDFVRVSAPVGGTLIERPIQRGDWVESGDLLFVLEAEAERAAVAETERRVAEAEAHVADLRKGSRPTEIAALEARLEQEQANFRHWDAELERHQQLFGDRVISVAELDQVATRRDSARAAVNSAVAELATAQLGGREDVIRAAEAEREAAVAALARARWSLDQKHQRAPVKAAVHDVLYEPGEYVAAGTPVAVLLPPGSLKVRFFVPQARLSSIAPGGSVEILADGAPRAGTARIVFISTEAEFTPPVIYSRDTRAKLVFMVEAGVPPDAAGHLRPGQPVDVRLPAAEPVLNPDSSE